LWVVINWAGRQVVGPPEPMTLANRSAHVSSLTCPGGSDEGYMQVRVPWSHKQGRRIEELKNICGAKAATESRTPALGERVRQLGQSVVNVQRSTFSSLCNSLGHHTIKIAPHDVYGCVHRFASIEPRHNYKERLLVNTWLLPNYSRKGKPLSAGHSYSSITTGSGSLGLNNARNRPSHIRCPL